MLLLLLLVLLLHNAGGLQGSSVMQLPLGSALGRSSGRRRVQKPNHVVSVAGS